MLKDTRSGGHKCNVLAVVFSEAAGYLITDDEVGANLDGGGRVILLGAALLSAAPPLVMWRCAALRLAGRIKPFGAACVVQSSVLQCQCPPAAHQLPPHGVQETLIAPLASVAPP